MQSSCKASLSLAGNTLHWLLACSCSMFHLQLLHDIRLSLVATMLSLCMVSLFHRQLQHIPLAYHSKLSPCMASLSIAAHSTRFQHAVTMCSVPYALTAASLLLQLYCMGIHLYVIRHSQLQHAVTIHTIHYYPLAAVVYSRAYIPPLLHTNRARP
jgi:hypothetical protein